MPIYAYRCAACGVEQDVLQKLSDAPLTVCPSCGAESFHKVLTAPAFQLKGSGWYVTDFRDGNKAKQAGSGNGASASKSKDAGSGSKADGATHDGAKADTPAKGADASSKSSGSASAGGATD
ncbi:MAG: FmdB family zinc ribbon protein [Burkholderiaceae bacterium]|jgi:putative FmdB family regulatory protein|nr:FmdB family zinc ribbon protein [Burkholderiaceae bacterium]